jgi:hypothetical protein
MSARDILKKDIKDLVPHASSRRPLPEGPGVSESDYSLKANLEALLRHSSNPIDKEILEAVEKYLSDRNERP